jgi:dephospho-CoA kinase
MIKFDDIRFQDLQEGLYDPNIFKAFFLAGGPGSGKSWVSERTLSGMGLKVVNSDTVFARALEKEKMSLDFANHNQKEVIRRDAIRDLAKKRTGVQLKLALEGRLGLILDSTARDMSRIESEANTMKHIGYDVHMVFVNTSLEVALKRNQMRARKVPDAVVMTSHKQIQQNIGKLQNLFRSNNFVIVDNNKVSEDVNPSVHKAIRRMINRKPTSYQAISWIKREIQKRKRK